MGQRSGHYQYRNVAQLDLVLTRPEDLWKVQQVRSDRWQALGTHHFLLEVSVVLGLDRLKRDIRTRYDLRALRQDDVKDVFARRFAELAHAAVHDTSEPETMTQSICHAAAETLPERKVQPLRPWIRSTTLSLIEERNSARNKGNRGEEKHLNEQIRNKRECGQEGMA